MRIGLDFRLLMGGDASSHLHSLRHSLRLLLAAAKSRKTMRQNVARAASPDPMLAEELWKYTSLLASVEATMNSIRRPCLPHVLRLVGIITSSLIHNTTQTLQLLQPSSSHLYEVFFAQLIHHEVHPLHSCPAGSVRLRPGCSCSPSHRRPQCQHPPFYHH